MHSIPQRIVSGGQTGVDRAALTVAIELGIEHGGWCPKGRRAEDGAIPDCFAMQELDSTDYSARTIRNIIDSDATLILHVGPLTGGTALTASAARQHNRPLLKIDLSEPCDAAKVREWLAAHQIKILNIAGPRESTCPGVFERSSAFLKRVLIPENAS